MPNSYVVHEVLPRKTFVIVQMFRRRVKEAMGCLRVAAVSSALERPRVWTRSDSRRRARCSCSWSAAAFSTTATTAASRGDTREMPPVPSPFVELCAKKTDVTGPRNRIHHIIWFRRCLLSSCHWLQQQQQMQKALSEIYSKDNTLMRNQNFQQCWLIINITPISFGRQTLRFA